MFVQVHLMVLQPEQICTDPVNKTYHLRLFGESLMFCLFKTLLGAVTTVAMLSAVPVLAQVVPTEIEGTLRNVNRANRTLRVMGVTVNVPDGTPINSPTARLTFNQINAAPDLPGRDMNGFLGGTAIVTGQVNPDGSITADSVFVEPAENVVVGVLGVGGASIAGMPVSLTTDPRLPSSVINAYGFVINPADIPAGTPGGVEGYYSASTNTLYAHTVEVDAPILPLANRTSPQISVLRISCENQGRLEIRGGVYVPTGSANRTIQVFRPNGTRIGTTTSAVDDPLFPLFGLYRFRSDIGNCPASVRITMDTATITVPVE
jgi:hypothetical protein